MRERLLRPGAKPSKFFHGAGDSRDDGASVGLPIQKQTATRGIIHLNPNPLMHSCSKKVRENAAVRVARHALSGCTDNRPAAEVPPAIRPFARFGLP